jgi:hypothetical protein
MMAFRVSWCFPQPHSQAGYEPWLRASRRVTTGHAVERPTTIPTTMHRLFQSSPHDSSRRCSSRLPLGTLTPSCASWACARDMGFAMRDTRTNTRPPRRERPRCGARTRAGGRCKAPVVWRSVDRRPRARCRLHGGLSTGPKTQAGKASSAANLGLKFGAQRAEVQP